MKLFELFERALILAGQFQIPVDRVELAGDRFKLLVKNTLGFYSMHSPYVQYLYLNANNTNSRQVTFQETDYPLGIPDMLFDVIPVRISGVIPYYLREYDRPRSNLDIKVEFPWTYRKPTLTLPTNAEFDIKAGYEHRVLNRGTKESPEWVVETISDVDTEYLDFLTGKFMQALALARDAFTINELPLVTNAATLLSEGKAKEEAGRQGIITNKKTFAAAWG